MILIIFWRTGSNMKEFQTEIYDKSFYGRDIIDAAIIAYKPFATIKLNDDGSCWKCTFDVKEYPEQMIINEFGNYLIELSQAK